MLFSFRFFIFSFRFIWSEILRDALWLQVHEEGRLACTLCPDAGRRFTRESLKMHEKRDHQAGQYWCEEAEGCGAVFQTRSELRTHQQQHHQETRTGQSDQRALSNGPIRPEL